MQLADTHCHIHFDNYQIDPHQAIKEASNTGVTSLICVGTTLSDSQKAINLAVNHQNIWASAGVHPHDAKKFISENDSAKKLKDLLKNQKIVAVGEIGLDFYKNYSSKDQQIEAFKTQINIGLPYNLPFIFHVRDAWEDFWTIFDSYSNLTGVVHSFSADSTQLYEILKRGLYVGLNGIMTFTTDEKQLEAARKVPLNKMLLETDAPFLTPKPFRGEVCQPKHILTIAEFLAELRGEDLESLAGATTKNAKHLFNL